MESILERLLGCWTLLYQCIQVPSKTSLWGCLVCALVRREASPGEPKEEDKGSQGWSKASRRRVQLPREGMSEVESERGGAGLKGQPDCGDTGAKRDEGRLEGPERTWSCPKVRRMGGCLFCRTGPKQGRSTGPFMASWPVVSRQKKRGGGIFFLSH